jgi:hypothetical protein
LDLKLANSQNPEQKPKVSKLPLPVSDSPLVIDLPDGQKIVIGKMTQGSVIEVATWRGVGRPDSRTSRLMLGVGSGNVNEEKEPSEIPQTPAKSKKPEDWRVVLYYLVIAVDFFKSLPWKKLVQKRKKSTITPVAVDSPHPIVLPKTENVDKSEPAIVIDEDIEAWLNKISAKTPPKKATATKKVVKKSAKPKAKRK